MADSAPAHPKWVQEDEDVTVRYQVKYEERDKENEPDYEKTLGERMTRENAWNIVQNHETPYMLRVRAMNVQDGTLYRSLSGDEFLHDPNAIFHEPV